MRQTIALIVSVVLGLIAVLAMKQHIDNKTKSNKEDTGMITIYKTSTYIQKGDLLTESKVEMVKIPQKYRAKDMITPIIFEAYKGKKANRDINIGHWLFATDFKESSIVTMSKIAPGHCVLSLSVNPVTGVSGLLRPNRFVDIYWTKEVLEANSKSSETHLLLSGVKVYSIDEMTDEMSLARSSNKRRSNRGPYKTVSVVVTFNEAAVLTNAQQSGMITLAMRKDKDSMTILNDRTLTSDEVPELSKKYNSIRKNRGGSN